MRRWLKTVVVNDAEKAHEMRHVGIRKTVRRLGSEFADEVSLREGGIKTGANRESSGTSPAGAR